jgi:hypothetical protein
MKLKKILERTFGTLIVVGGIATAYGAVSKNEDVCYLGAGSLMTGLAGVIITAKPADKNYKREDYHDEDDTDFHDENN